MIKSGFFDGIPQTAVKVGAYNTFYPVFYRDTAHMALFMLAPLEKIKSILPSIRMHPFRLTPWHGMVTLSATQHKDSDIGPYNMVDIGVPFVLDKATPLFTGILHKIPEVPMIYLPYFTVNTEIARVTGVELANYPAFHAEINFEEDDKWMTCVVNADGGNIMKLSGRKLELKKFPREHFCPVTVKGNRLLRSEFNFSESDTGVSKKPSDVRLQLGDHPIGLKLKELKLGKVLQYQYCPSGQSILSMVSECYPI
jgi:nitrogen fixation protein